LKEVKEMLVSLLKGLAAAALGVSLLVACAPQQSGDVLAGNRARTASTVSFGTVVSSRVVTLQGGQGGQAAGAVLGGIAGAALGQEVGGGTGQVIATGVGATAGAAAGLQAGRAAGSRQSIEWTVRLDNGGTIAVVQGEPTFAIGQRVQVITGGGQTRLAPA
jgi:outer membrane lipoprotein SlyB